VGARAKRLGRGGALACALLALAGSVPAAAQERGGAAAAVQVDLQRRLGDVELVESEGQLYVRAGPQGELVPAAAWTRALQGAQEQRQHSGLVYRLLNITSPWGLAWIAIGFLGQGLFTIRMLLQWWASEKAKRSIVPIAFWWSSLLGGMMLLVYFCWRKDAIGILGQSTGVFVYARNLVLIHRHARQAPEPSPRAV
jgi:lipid-A-disaccharide synthase-like uncharacterized protein